MVTWSLISIVAAASATVAIEKARPRLDAANHSTLNNTASPVALTVNQAPRPKPRNLSLQPEAFKLSKRLGLRFADPERPISLVTGTVTIGSRVQVVRLTRRQTARGERIEIAVATDASLLTWDESEGAKSTTRPPNEIERALIERLTFDSADQFVLAQLRGASYYTVGRSVRPADVGSDDNYPGPLWDIVRIGESVTGSPTSPISPFRLYFINTRTGLLDKVLSQEPGDAMTQADFSNWKTLAALPSRCRLRNLTTTTTGI